MDKQEQEDTDDNVEIVDLDEQSFTFSAWRKHVFASLSHYKRAWISLACASLCLLLLVTAFSIPFSAKQRMEQGERDSS